MTNYEQLEETMDKREAFIIKLRVFHQKFNYIPRQYRTIWETAKRENFVPWRENKKAVKKLKKAAKRMDKNCTHRKK